MRPSRHRAGPEATAVAHNVLSQLGYMMIGNLLTGCVAIVFCLTVQCIVVSIVLRALIRLEQKKILRATWGTAALLLIGATLTMLIGILLQITIWAGLFWGCGEFTDFHTAFYHSIVNFTSLGYGDLVMSPQRRLLGALEATNGVLMLGLTTAFLYSVLHALINRRLEVEFPSDAAR